MFIIIIMYLSFNQLTPTSLDQGFDDNDDELSPFNLSWKKVISLSLSLSFYFLFLFLKF